MNTSVTNNPPFQVGQKVVCVKAGKTNKEYPYPGIFKKGETATIYQVYENGNKWDIELYEDLSWAYPSQCFAPIQETYTDIREELATGAMNVGDTSDITPFTKRELQKQIS